MNAKDLMKLAGVKSEKDFYSMFPTEEAFFEAYPETMQYKKGGKIKKKFKSQDPAAGYREFPPNVMQMGGSIGAGYNSGFISPLEEAKYNNDWTQPKQAKQTMSAGENVGWTALDLIASPVGLSGKPLSSYLTNKVNSGTGQEGSWFGNIESDYIHPVASGFLAESGIPVASQIGAAGQAVNKTVSPMVNQDNPERIAMQSGLGAIGSAAGGMYKDFSNMGDDEKDKDKNKGMGNSMSGMRYGGKIKYQMGGQMPMEGMGLNELMGPTHNEGGMTISPETEVEGGETILEAESYVFSDSIKVPGKNKTFAQESKSIKNKYKLRPDDKLSKESSEAELEALMNMQEETKAAMMAKDQEKFQNKMMMKYGGFMPGMQYSLDRNMQPVEMQDGGGIRRMGQRKFQDIMDFQDNPMFEDPANYRNIELTGNQLVWGDENVDFKNPRQARRFYNTLQSGVSAPSEREMLTPIIGTEPLRTMDFGTNMEINAGLKQGPLEQFPVASSKKSSDNKKKFDPNKLRIPNSAIAGLTAGLKGLGKQKLYLTPQAQVNYINTRPAEVLAEQQGELGLAAGLAGLKDNAVNQGNYLANVANMAATSGMGTGANVGNIRFQGDMQNVGTANLGALQRQATIAANNALRTQYDTSQMLRRDKIMEDYNRIGQTSSTDLLKRENQDLLLSLIAQDRVKFEGDKIYYKINPGTKEEKWVPANK
jgi:hypothetical protein